MPTTDAQRRDRMIFATMAAGVDRSDAAEIVDLGKHAFDEAMKAAQRVTDTASPDNRVPVFCSVLASFATIMREHFPQHWAAFVATEAGTEVSTVIVMPDESGS